MRRSLLTAIRTAVSLAFGNPATAGTNNLASGNLLVDLNTSCPGTGTLTTINYYTTRSGTISVYVGAVVGGTFTIRSTTDITSTGVGAQTAAISLPVVAGDRFALWCSASLTNMATLTGSYGFSAAATKPVSGSYALTNTTATIAANFA